VNKLLATTALTLALSFAGHANATDLPYCGHAAEHTDSVAPPSTVTLSNGHVITSNIWTPLTISSGSSLLGTGGQAFRGNIRWCGQGTIYLFTGSSASGSGWFAVTVDVPEDIVSPSVAQVKCFAFLSRTADVYYDFNSGSPAYSDGWWPNGTFYQQGDAVVAGSPSRQNVDFWFYVPYALDSWTAYAVNISCPYNVPPT